jgi:phage virion morphogenesis protein
MATSIEITISENVSEALDRAMALGADLTPVMGEISGMMVTETQYNFLGQHEPLGTAWVKRKPHPGKVDEPHPILRKSGDMFRSIKENYTKDFAEAGPEASGGAAIYARIHQFGGVIRPKAENRKGVLNTPFGPRKSVTIPARPYLGWSPKMEDRTLEILTSHLSRAFSGVSDGVVA